tara:strand:+ start:330 stop:713 length:384 start_codon:yes stop_codon:yes gene_type:complete
MSITERYNDFIDNYDTKGCDGLDAMDISNGNILLQDIKNENAIRTNQIMQIFLTNPSNGILDMKNIKNNYDFRLEQDKTEKITFLEKYLFLIIKCIFFITLLGLLFMRISPYILEIIGNTSVNKNIT